MRGLFNRKREALRYLWYLEESEGERPEPNILESALLCNE